MIELKNRAFYINGKPLFIYSGEVHYFRIEPQNWLKVIRLAKEAGLNTIASYIPWRFHELNEGIFDFAGKTHPRRNLKKWLNLLFDEEMYFIPRIGPVSNGEMKNEGLPAWLLEKYKETCLIMESGEAIHHQGTPSYKNPKFLELTEKWYDKLLTEIAPYQIQYNGNIILVQLCNEIAMVNWLAKAPDFSPFVTSLYQNFLQNKYKTIENLNKLYKTNYTNFKEIRQPSVKISDNILPEHWDRAEFYREYYAEYFKTLKSFVTKRGITVPVISNIPQFYDFDVRGRGIYATLTTTMFDRFVKKVKDVVFGGAYQMRRLDYENYHDISMASSVIKMICGKNPVLCAELQTGIMYDRPKLYPKDVELNLKQSTSQGLNGLNCYMFAGGTNTEDIGQFGSYHEWQAPISSNLEKRPHFEVLKNFGKLIKAIGEEITLTQKEISCCLGFYTPYYKTEYMDGKVIKEIDFKRQQYFFDGIARLLEINNYSFEFVDIEKHDISDSNLPLWVYSDTFMDLKTQKKLLYFVENGGILSILPLLPVVDLYNRKCDFLIKTLGLQSSTVESRLIYTPIGDIFVDTFKVLVFEPNKKDEILATTMDKSVCGFIRRFGKGKILVLGFPLNDKFNIIRDYFKFIAKKIGMQKKINVHPELLSATIRKGPDGSFIFAGNFHDMKIKGYIEYKNIRIPQKGDIEFKERSLFVIPFNLKITKAVRLIYAFGELSEKKLDKNKIVLKFEPIDKTNFEAKLIINKKIRYFSNYEISIRRQETEDRSQEEKAQRMKN
ncbi:MAG: beta-galactosidase [Candidatus Hydrogenedentota bacterium]